MVTQEDVTAVLKIRERLEQEYADRGDERLVTVVAYVAAAQAALRLMVKRQAGREKAGG